MVNLVPLLEARAGCRWRPPPTARPPAPAGSAARARRPSRCAGVLVQGGGAHRAQLPAGEHGLEQVRGVHRALRRPGPDDGVELVDEQDHLALGLVISARTALSRSSNSPRYFAPPAMGAHVEGHHALVAQRLGDVPADDALGEALHIAVCCPRRLTDEHRVVLGAAREHLDDAAHLLVPADDRVELAGARGLGEVAAVLLERLVLALRVGVGDPRGAAHLLQAASSRSWVRPPCTRASRAGDGSPSSAMTRCSVDRYSSPIRSASSPARRSTRRKAGESCSFPSAPRTCGRLATSPRAAALMASMPAPAFSSSGSTMPSRWRAARAAGAPARPAGCCGPAPAGRPPRGPPGRARWVVDSHVRSPSSVP